MEYKPYRFNAGATDIAAEEHLIGSSATGLTLNSTTVRLAVDFLVKNASQYCNKYVGVAKARMRNSGASSGGTEVGSARWTDTVTTSTYHNGLTYFNNQHLGLASGRAAGMMYVTYYMWFKG